MRRRSGSLTGECRRASCRRFRVSTGLRLWSRAFSTKSMRIRATQELLRRLLSTSALRIPTVPREGAGYAAARVTRPAIAGKRRRRRGGGRGRSGRGGGGDGLRPGGIPEGDDLILERVGHDAPHRRRDLQVEQEAVPPPADAEGLMGGTGRGGQPDHPPRQVGATAGPRGGRG